MGNSVQSADPVPTHLRGRSSPGGPMAGSYGLLGHCAIETVAPSQTDLPVGIMPIFCNCRITAIIASCEDSSGSATRGTVQVTDGTSDLLDGEGSLVDNAAATFDAEGSAVGLVEAQRDRDYGDVLRAFCTTIAGETVTRLKVEVWGYWTGHYNDSSAFD